MAKKERDTKKRQPSKRTDYLEEETKRPGDRMETDEGREEAPHHKNLPPPKEERNTLFIKNINKEAIEEDIEEVFMRVLPDLKILSTRIVRDEEGNRRGFGFMDVETKEMAEKALKLNNYNIKGSAIKVYLSRPPG